MAVHANFGSTRDNRKLEEVVNKPHKCPLCPRKFLFLGNRNKHLTTHTEGKMVPLGADVLQCTYCPLTFIKPSYLYRHQAKYHPKLVDGHIETKHFECAHCGEVLESLPKLRRHVVYKHGAAADKQRYPCPHCPVGCRTAVGLTTHLRVHTGERPYACSICDKAFKRTQALTIHLRNVHGINHGTCYNKQMYQCANCDVQLKQCSAMIKHFLRSHRKFRRFICGVCGARFYENQQLRYHMVTQHKMDAPAISTTSRQRQTEVYVYPGIGKLPPTHPHAIFMLKIVDSEKQKTENLPDFHINKSMSTSKPNSNGWDNLKPCAKPMINNDVVGKNYLNPSAATKVTYIEKEDFSDDSDSTIVDQHEISYHHPSTQDALSLVAPMSAGSSENNRLTFANNEDSSPHKQTLIVASNSQLPLLMLNSHPTSTECSASTSVSSSPGLQHCHQTDIHKAANFSYQHMIPRNNKTQKSNNTDLPHISQPELPMLKCDKCDKVFIDNKRLERHGKTHSGIHTFACNVCNKTFLEKYNLSVHMRTHSGSRPFQCDECGKSMRYHQEFQHHQRSHRGEQPFTCPQCPDRSFVRAKDLRRHEKSKHQPSNTGWTCSSCSKVFSRKDSLEVHVKKIHYRNLHPTYQCSVCEHSFSSESLLRQHRLLHSGRKEHACTQCGKLFAIKSYLQKHMRMHQQRTNYLQCSFCPRKFATQKTLMVHQNIFHDKNTMHLKRQAQMDSFENSTSDYFVRVEAEANLEAELDLTQLQLGPVDGDKDIHVVFLQVLSDANL